jgi:hypothetical protein
MVKSITILTLMSQDQKVESLRVHSPLLAAKFVKLSMILRCLQLGISSVFKSLFQHYLRKVFLIRGKYFARTGKNITD